MVSLRTIGAVLRGNLTKSQVFLAGFLGMLLGFVPGFVMPSDVTGGFLQAPGLILALLLLVLVLNCNLAAFSMTLVLGKALSTALLGPCFEVGRFLLDGPTSALFKSLINAPVLAWFGLEYYATTGGVAIGLVLGAAWGMVMLKLVTGFRKAMTGMEENSAAYKKHSRKILTRLLVWTFLGKKGGKQTWREKLEAQKLGMPVRISGLICVVLIAGGLWAMQSFLGGAALRSTFREGLERANGATVDLAELDLDLGGLAITVGGLGLADPNDLGTDIFRAKKLVMSLGAAGLLSRRLEIEQITSIDAQTGAKRAAPGTLVRGVKAPPPPPPPEKKEGDNGKTLGEYLKDVEVWQKRLAQANRWLAMIFRSEESETVADRKVRLEHESREYGRAAVAATHLIAGAPMILIKKLTLDGISIATDDSQHIDVHGSNLSSQPGLVKAPAAISLKSSKDRFGVSLGYEPGKKGFSGTFFYNEIPVDPIVAQLKTDKPPLQGGRLAIKLDGLFEFRGGQGAWIDLPLHLTLVDTTMTLGSLKPTKIDKLELPIGLRGPITSPRVSLDDKAIADALVRAGRAELADEVRAQAQKLIGDKVAIPKELGAVSDVIKGDKSVSDAAKETADEAKKKAEDLAKKAAEDARKKAEEEAKKKAAEELKKRLPGGLFGGKKK